MLGTQNNSFERLLKELDKLKEKKIIKEKIIVQAGYTKYESKNLEVFDFIDKDKLEKCSNNNIKLLYYSNLGIDYPYKVFENKELLIKEIRGTND